MAEIYQFRTRRARCAWKYCGKPIVLKNPGNIPAYCDYTCGCAAQPEHTKQALISGMSE